MSCRTSVTMLLLGALVLSACGAPPQDLPTPSPSGPTAPLPPAQLADRTAPDIPAVAERQAAIRAVLATDTPVLPLPGLDALPQQAQAIALADPQVPAAAGLAGVPGVALAEVFGVVPFTAADVTEATQSCGQDCWRVVLYSYGANSTISVIVSLSRRAVLDVAVVAQAQPEIPPHLAALAVDIARASPLVQQELQMEPGAAMAIYASVKTSLTGSQCERSRHLCVAPTFVWGESALWAIVDLTDLTLVGTTWTALGVSARRRASETSLQNAVVGTLCEQAQPLDRGDWSLRYQITASDGLAISAVAFRGQPLLDQAKIVDWHVAYTSSSDPTVRTGFSDAIGCPVFSSAVVVPFDLPQIEPIIEGGAEVGFRLVQDFRNELWPVPCNYRYQNVYAFYTDGRFQMRGVSLGRPCGMGGVYRPIFRIVPAGAAQTIAAWDGAAWAGWDAEQWALPQPATPSTAAGDQLRITLAGGRAYTLRPGREPRPDQAFVYVTRYRPEEGDGDLPSLGTCCQVDHRQGPETFIDQPPEPLVGAKVVIWYVPQLPNAERAFCWADSRLDGGLLSAEVWPCDAGPTLVPAAEGL